MSTNTFLKPTNQFSPFKQAIWQQIDDFAIDALYDELNLENKPGLVCPSGNGSHLDMNYDTFIASITSLRGYFATLSKFGYENRAFDDLKDQGIYQEAKMLEATNGINTHKGAIFNLGFASAAIGLCLQQNKSLSAQNICEQVVDSWQYDLTHRLGRSKDSHGQQMYKRYGVTGAIEMVANGFQIIQGLETLPIRIQKHSENALKLAEWLESQEEVAWVNYPGLKSSKYYALAQQYLPKGQSGLVTFGLKGGFEAAKKVADETKLFSLLANIGDTKSLIIHPASTTHQQLSEQEQITAGVPKDLIRLSVGLEDIDDLIGDLKSVFATIKESELV